YRRRPARQALVPADPPRLLARLRADHLVITGDRGQGRDHLVGKLRAVIGVLGRGAHAYDDVVPVDFLEQHRRLAAGGRRDLLIEGRLDVTEADTRTEAHPDVDRL